MRERLVAGCRFFFLRLPCIKSVAAIVLVSLLLVREDVVSFGDFVEQDVRASVRAAVGVVFSRKRTIRAFELRWRSCRCHTENVVIVFKQLFASPFA